MKNCIINPSKMTISFNPHKSFIFNHIKQNPSPSPLSKPYN